MKNTAFLLRNEAEKEAKLTAMLRQRTKDRLTPEQLRLLALRVQIGRQYNVYVHTDPGTFCQRLVLVHSNQDEDQGGIVFGQALFGLASDTDYAAGTLFAPHHAACAIIVRKRESGKAIYHEIHIYLPPQYERKGTYYGQKQKAPHRV